MKYRKLPVVVDAVQWNVPDIDGSVKLARECFDHSKVRSTCYTEVAALLGTSGCSRGYPLWNWSVMGIIDTMEGQHVVCPGDWVLTGVLGEHWPVKPEIFALTYEQVGDNE